MRNPEPSFDTSVEPTRTPHLPEHPQLPIEPAQTQHQLPAASSVPPVTQAPRLPDDPLNLLPRKPEPADSPSAPIAEAVVRFDSPAEPHVPTVAQIDLASNPIAATVEKFEAPPSPVVPKVDPVEISSAPIAPVVEQFEAPADLNAPKAEPVEIESAPIAPTVERFETSAEPESSTVAQVDTDVAPIARVVEQFRAAPDLTVSTVERMGTESAPIGPTVEQFEALPGPGVQKLAKADVDGPPIARALERFEGPAESMLPAAGPPDTGNVEIARAVERFEAPVVPVVAKGSIKGGASVPIATVVEKFETPVDPNLMEREVATEQIDVAHVGVAETVQQIEAPLASSAPKSVSMEMMSVPVAPIVKQSLAEPARSSMVSADAATEKDTAVRRAETLVASTSQTVASGKTTSVVTVVSSETAVPVAISAAEDLETEAVPQVAFVELLDEQAISPGPATEPVETGVQAPTPGPLQEVPIVESGAMATVTASESSVPHAVDDLKPSHVPVAPSEEDMLTRTDATDNATELSTVNVKIRQKTELTEFQEVANVDSTQIDVQATVFSSTHDDALADAERLVAELETTQIERSLPAMAPAASTTSGDLPDGKGHNAASFQHAVLSKSVSSAGKHHSKPTGPIRKEIEEHTKQEEDAEESKAPTVEKTVHVETEDEAQTSAEKKMAATSVATKQVQEVEEAIVKSIEIPATSTESVTTKATETGLPVTLGTDEKEQMGTSEATDPTVSEKPVDGANGDSPDCQSLPRSTVAEDAISDTQAEFLAEGIAMIEKDAVSSVQAVRSLSVPVGSTTAVVETNTMESELMSDAKPQEATVVAMTQENVHTFVPNPDVPNGKISQQKEQKASSTDPHERNVQNAVPDGRLSAKAPPGGSQGLGQTTGPTRLTNGGRDRFAGPTSSGILQTSDPLSDVEKANGKSPVTSFLSDIETRRQIVGEGTGNPQKVVSMSTDSIDGVSQTSHANPDASEPKMLSTPVSGRELRPAEPGSPLTPNVDLPRTSSSRPSRQGNVVGSPASSSSTRASRRLVRETRAKSPAPTSTSAKSKPPRPVSPPAPTRRSTPSREDSAGVRKHSASPEGEDATGVPASPASSVVRSGRAARLTLGERMRIGSTASRHERSASMSRCYTKLPRVAELTGNEVREKKISPRPRLPRVSTFSGIIPRSKSTALTTTPVRRISGVPLSPLTPRAAPSSSNSAASSVGPDTPKARTPLRRTLSFSHSRRSTITPSSTTSQPTSPSSRPPPGGGSSSRRRLHEILGSPTSKRLERRATMSMTETTRGKPPLMRVPRSKPTVPQPFELTGLELHEKSQQQIEAARRRADEMERRRRSFKAKPMPDFSNPYPKPFV